MAQTFSSCLHFKKACHGHCLRPWLEHCPASRPGSAESQKRSIRNSWVLPETSERRLAVLLAPFDLLWRCRRGIMVSGGLGIPGGRGCSPPPPAKRGCLLPGG